MKSTEIFLEYCQQKASANKCGLVLVSYKKFLDEFDARHSTRRLQLAKPVMKSSCVGTLKE